MEIIMFFSKNKKKLTIGMATYDDYDGVYFTIQSLRMYHNLDEKDVDYIVIDNNPSSKHGEATKSFVQNWVKGKYIPYTEKRSTSTRNLIFENSESEYTICMDPHVMLYKNGISHLINYFEGNISNQKNLVQGPLLYDDLKNTSTHFDPVWRDSMYGTWATNKEALEKNEPFDIPMQGLGVFACKTDNWLEFNENFRGFGGEEGYIHEKFRQNGGRTICLPQFKWIHRFGRPNGVPYPLKLEDRIWNYFIGWLEIYKDPNHQTIQDIKEHFKEKIGVDKVKEIFEEALKTHYDDYGGSDILYKFPEKNSENTTMKSLIPKIPVVEKL
jgi:hypothetical protein